MTNWRQEKSCRLFAFLGSVSRGKKFIPLAGNKILCVGHFLAFFGFFSLPV